MANTPSIHVGTCWTDPQTPYKLQLQDVPRAAWAKVLAKGPGRSTYWISIHSNLGYLDGLGVVGSACAEGMSSRQVKF